MSIDRKGGGVFAIVPAAGVGARFGSPKAFYTLAQRPVIERTATVLLSVTEIDEIIVVVRAEDLSRAREVFGGERRIRCVIGGARRRESVQRGIDAIGAGRLSCAADALVVVHDAARCLVTQDLIERCIAAARLHGAVTAAIPAVDALVKVSDKQQVEDEVDRRSVWLVQTPQVFRLALLQRAHQAGDEDAADDASLVRRFHAVTVVEGERSNLKLTSLQDAAIFERLMLESGRQ